MLSRWEGYFLITAGTDLYLPQNIGLIKRMISGSRLAVGSGGPGWSRLGDSHDSSSFKAKKPDTEKEDDMTVKAVRESNRRRRRSF